MSQTPSSPQPLNYQQGHTNTQNWNWNHSHPTPSQARGFATSDRNHFPPLSSDQDSKINEMSLAIKSLLNTNVTIQECLKKLLQKDEKSSSDNTKPSPEYGIYPNSSKPYKTHNPVNTLDPVNPPYPVKNEYFNNEYFKNGPTNYPVNYPVMNEHFVNGPKNYQR